MGLLEFSFLFFLCSVMLKCGAMAYQSSKAEREAYKLARQLETYEKRRAIYRR